MIKDAHTSTAKAGLLLLILLFAAGACVSAGTTGTKRETITVPGPVPLGEETVTPDIKLVAAAIIQKLRGADDRIVGVRFDPANMQAEAEPDFRFEGFKAVNLGITGYTAEVVGKTEVRAMLEGVILFQDVFERSASVFFSARYTVGPREILVAASRTVNIPNPVPRIETYMVPAEALKAMNGRLKTFTDYYVFAVQNAEPMTSQAGQCSVSPKGDYLIMGFCKDRLRPESDLEMKVSDKRSLSGKALLESVYIYDHGWRIMLAGGKFRPGSIANKFYIGIRYTIDPAQDDEAMTLALYQNKKMDREPAVVVAEASPAEPHAAPFAEGPLGSGTVFLDLTQPSDVMVIQKRFKALGLYAQVVDGAIGPGTRRAFDVFADQHGLQRGLWTVDMQKLLFQGSGL
jgi:hypothetical protein